MLNEYILCVYWCPIVYSLDRKQNTCSNSNIIELNNTVMTWFQGVNIIAIIL